MADQAELPEGALPQPTEEIHLPEPSYVPVVLAFGITIAIVGVVLSWVIVAIGVIIAAIALFRWIRQTRSEMSELPLGH
ncbi:MAG TPA: cytochrome c oxidase subunit 4 [Thermoleophilaceae bacterium]|jgi:Flp pilus assembly protein TadB